MTDCNKYIQLAQEIFGEIIYIEDINRINDEGDSLPQLDKYTGFILGSDIICETLILSLCNYIYMSRSNIMFLLELLNKNINREINLN